MDRENLKDSFNNAKDKTEGVYYDMKDKLEETGEKIKNKTQEFLDEGKEKFEHFEKYASEYEEAFINKVRERPLTSLLIAAGTGFLLSYLFKDKNKH